MNAEDERVYVQSQIACAMIEMEAMKAANSQHPQDQPYEEKAFRDLIDKYGIYHNAVIGTLNNQYR